jgi:hypothetical protein
MIPKEPWPVRCQNNVQVRAAGLVRTNLLQHVVFVVLGHDYGSAIMQETCKKGMLVGEELRC